jgi:putative inorganic carbon (hco3(-)) transporter
VSFWLFCALVVSNHLHLTARFPALGAVRFDLLLAIAALVTMIMSRPRDFKPPPQERETTRRLITVVGFAVAVIPFARWPGSVIDHGLETFLRAAIYYFLVVGTLRTERQLAIFLTVFGATQVFRVMEPLYLNLTEGYWGSSTNMGNWTAMDRLSGAPMDIVNPNGLAYIVVSTLPLLYFAQRRMKTLWRGGTWGVMAAMVYTLMLTGSRSGFLVLAMLIGAWVWTSKHRAVAMTMCAVLSVVIISGMSELQRDRYLSIFRSDVPGAATAQGRLDGVAGDFKAALARPIFGHGLGTSYEVNTWVRGGAQISHNLYAETAQELGFVGLGVFLAFIWSALKGSWKASRMLHERHVGSALAVAGEVMPVLMGTLFVFSFASYGLSEYHWYLLAGMGVVTVRLVNLRAASHPETHEPAVPAATRPTPLPGPRPLPMPGRR